jgi:hypothetical protein
MLAWEMVRLSLVEEDSSRSIKNMFHKEVNKDSSTKQEIISSQVLESRCQRKRDDHGNDRKSRSMSRYHHSPRKSTRINHASLGPRSSPSMSPI